MHLSTITDGFLANCQAKGLSLHTIRAYRQDLRDLSTWMIRENLEPPVTKDIVLRWIEDIRARDLAPASIKRRLACLRVLCRWLESEGRVPENPFHRLRTPIRVPNKRLADKQVARPEAHPRACFSLLFTATNRIVGRPAASAMASASAVSFFWRFTNGFRKPAGST